MTAILHGAVLLYDERVPSRARLVLLTVLAATGVGACHAQRPAEELLRQARDAFKRGEADLALALSSSAVEADPSDARTYWVRGSIYETLERYVEALADFNTAVQREPDAAEVYNRRGSIHFKLGRIEDSITDFDRAIELEPAQEPHHWQRGISYYYAGRYEDGRRQFELHQTVNPNDVENAVWHYLCKARIDGAAAARAALLKIGEDSRVPMKQIYELFRGAANVDDVLAAAHAGEPPPAELSQRLFYARLYIGLFHEAAGNVAGAREFIMSAAGDHKLDHYMWHVARVHAALLREAGRKEP